MSGKESKKTFKYPGIRMAMDGNTAVIMCEREASDAAGAYPITPSTQMGEYWAEEVAKGHLNIADRELIFVEPESEHAAAAVTAGMSMSGLRATNFSSAQGVAFMHESLYAAVGKRLPYLLNVGCRAITKASLNVHCAHDDYHCIDDTGFFQVMGKDAQAAADLNLICRKTAELSLTPAAVGQDGFLTTHLIESVNIPERELIAEYCGLADDIIDCPTPAQRMTYGNKRRRVPEVWDVDNPMVSGPVQNQDAYMQAVAAQRPYFFDHIVELFEQSADEYYQLTGRHYKRVGLYKVDEADYLIIGMGSLIGQSEAIADYLQETRGLKVGVLNLTMFRPFPGDMIGSALKGKKGVVVLERTDQPLAEDLPIMREIRAAITKCMENGVASKNKPFETYASYQKRSDAPPLFSGCYGLGSRDLQPEGIIGAIENMLPEGAQKKFFYLSVDFVRDEPANPKQEIHMQKLLDDYPQIKNMAVRGSENPNLLPENSITVRMHSVGGWGAITTGKNLVMTLYDLLGYDIKANPKYGSEKKGQPTTYFLSAAPEPIRINCEYHYVDLVLSPDPNVFGHSDPLSGLKKGGSFVIQSDLADADEVWATIPFKSQKFIIDNEIRVFFVDGFKIAREEASNPELQFRMQGNAFQGAFFAASPLMERSSLDEKGLFKAIEGQLKDKFGGKGSAVVEDNLRVVRRGFDELIEITNKAAGVNLAAVARKEAGIPIMLKHTPVGDGGLADVHAFWEKTASFYARGQGDENLVDPFIGLSVFPAATGIYRDMTNIRFEYPQWRPENCTACGDCYTTCPDAAIPGLVNSVSEIFDTVINNIEKSGIPTLYLRRETRNVEKRLRKILNEAGEAADVRKMIDLAVLEHLKDSALEGKFRDNLEREFALFVEALGDFKFAITKPYFLNNEKKTKNSGGLFSITVNPYTCKGCMECVEVCKDKALVPVAQNKAAIETLRDEWAFWLDLPSTSQEFSRIDDLDEKIGALQTLLLDKRNYAAMSCGDGACLGCGEKTALHIFTGTATALMQPRVKAQIEKLNKLAEQLEQHVRLKLADNIDLSDQMAIETATQDNQDRDLTLSCLTASLEQGKISHPIDPVWLRWVTQLIEKLRYLKWQYEEGTTSKGRAEMGIINSTGCTSVWGATFPYNPYPFPWTSHLFQDSPSVAMGIFEGHMRKMSDGFKTIRIAELELAGKYTIDVHDDFFKRFNWKQFTDEEFLLCPPVVAVGGDGAMYDIGFQNLSRQMMSGVPVKVMVLDTQVYSNTGGQACTSTFVGQVADMSPYGKAAKGKTETRKEMSLIAAAHRTSYVLQSSAATETHMIEGFIEGLNSRRPAIFNIYTTCQPEHGVADDASTSQAKLAMDSRAYPLFKFDPDAGTTFEECCSIKGNPAVNDDWLTYQIDYIDDEGKAGRLEVPLTFADFAVTEGRFRKQFRQAPPETWNDDMVQLHLFLDLDEDERQGKFPYIWGVDARNHLTRILVAQPMVLSCEERRQFWHQLRSIAGEDVKSKVDAKAVADQARAEMAQSLAANLLAMSCGNVTAPDSSLTAGVTAVVAETSTAAPLDYEPVWIETPECTACDECINLAPGIFQYNDDKLAVVMNRQGGTFEDIVKSAEKCTAQAIHPGTPWNSAERNLDKLIKRSEKFQ
ncbi:2-oxoacid:acceptor oxidoreductase family protein [Shewanella atlantica]|uniref:Pyruvate ferredoxin oxidoreductase n=1 Tax=Shewanella atlantica TaxID=271099 RepID=A0A3S0KM41_9GAMM|nr:2-oxoacid:acceptor oxidoreductase family protein [Shewanella atlantica]RTR33560.1 pyruvate ferredoxin oxidoreductase [Shewanella atlantica]